MYLADAKCDDCNLIYSISKEKIIDDFISGKCPKCKSKNTRRLFNPIIANVCEGMVGNAKTRYTKSATYHPSEFGTYKGTRIK